tara:strand:+ start:32592 stop:32807 length:216 start_codon:yes stop_codon:yes gene_type:complete
MIGGMVALEILILSFFIFTILIHSIYLHLTIQRFKKDFQGLTNEMNNLDSKADTLKTWTFEMYNWAKGRGK